MRVHILYSIKSHVSKRHQSSFRCGGSERSPYPKGKPLYRSNDGGHSWASITDSLERHSAVPVKLDPTGSQILYLGVARGTPFGWRDRPSVADGAIMRSRDSGNTWEQLAEGLPHPLLSMLPKQ